MVFNKQLTLTNALTSTAWGKALFTTASVGVLVACGAGGGGGSGAVSNGAGGDSTTPPAVNTNPVPINTPGVTPTVSNPSGSSTVSNPSTPPVTAPSNTPTVSNPSGTPTDSTPVPSVNLGNCAASSSIDTDSDGVPDALEPCYQLNAQNKDNNIFEFTDNSLKLFVAQQYRDFLLREADSTGLNFWTNEIKSGRKSKVDMYREFYKSPEYQDNVAPVTRLYFAAYLRVPDYAGLNFWIKEYRNANNKPAKLAEIANAFANAPEFTSLYGTLTNTDFVKRLYEKVLTRSANDAEIEDKVNRLNASSATRGQILLEFSESDEYKNDSTIAPQVFIVAAYNAILRRMPTTAEYLADANAAIASNDLTAIQKLYNSPEHAARFMTQAPGACTGTVDFASNSNTVLKNVAGGKYALTVARSDASQACSVQIQLCSDASCGTSAVIGQDYSIDGTGFAQTGSSSITLNFAKGANTASINFGILNNTAQPNAVKFDVRLLNPSYGITQLSERQSVTIFDGTRSGRVQYKSNALKELNVTTGVDQIAAQVDLLKGCLSNNTRLFYAAQSLAFNGESAVAHNCDYVGPGSQITIYNKDYSVNQTIKHYERISRDFKMSPDGKYIAYGSFTTDSRGNVNKKSTQVRDRKGSVVAEFSVFSDFSWMGGDRLLLNVSDQLEIWKIGPSGATAVSIVPVSSPVFDIEVSRDDSKIVFSAAVGNRQHIFLMNIDGSGRRQVTTSVTQSAHYPVFSPNGQELLFSTSSCVHYAWTNNDLYLMQVIPVSSQMLDVTANGTYGRESPYALTGNRCTSGPAYWQP